MIRFPFGNVYLGAAAMALLSIQLIVPANALETKVYDLPAGMSASTIAAGPDGKLWFTTARP